MRPLRRLAGAAVLVLFGAQVTTPMPASPEGAAQCAEMGMPAMDGHGAPPCSHHSSHDSAPMHCPAMQGMCAGCVAAIVVVTGLVSAPPATPVAAVGVFEIPASTASAPDPPPPRA